MSETRALPVIQSVKRVESFSAPLSWLKRTDELRLDASFYNPRVAEAISILQRSGLQLASLASVTKRIFIPPRFKRIYVDAAHGVPFLQGSHVVHFQPADIKFLSRTAHTRLDRWIIESGWILVTCSGTIGRVAIAPPSWDKWAASQHILRIVPDPESACPAGYICAYLSSELGQAQLTSRIYGAVVDEITEEQAQSVLIPKPSTAVQKRIVEEIDLAAKEAVLAKDQAVRLALQSVQGVSSLIPELADTDAEEVQDAEIARRRLADIEASSERLVSGKELKTRLAQIEK